MTRGRTAAALVAVVAWGVLLPVAVAAYAGSLSIPHNDDFAYLRSAATFAETGDVRLFGWPAMALVGQLVLSWPVAQAFGTDVEVFNLLVAACAAAGLTATFLLFRQLLDGGRALLGTAIVGAFPPLGLLATSFMTDVPAFLFAAASLAAGVAGLRRRSAWLLAASAALGLWGFAVREPVVAAPLAVLAVAALTDPALRRRALGVAAALLAACAVIFAWRKGLPDSHVSPEQGLDLVTAAQRSWKFVVTLAFAALPAVLVWWRPPGARWRVPLAAALAVALLGTAAAGGALSGNYLTEVGPYRTQPSPAMLPWRGWQLLSLLAVGAAGLLLCGLWLRSRAARPSPARLRAFAAQRPAHAVLVLFGLLYAGAFAVLLPFGYPLFDRYALTLLLPLVPLLLAAAPPLTRRTGAAAAAGLVVLMATGAATLLNGAAWDAARWAAAEGVVRTGVPATDVDAGFEWAGYHAPGGARSERLRLPRPADHARYYRRMFPASGECFLIDGVASGRDGFAPAGRHAYKRFLFFGEAELFVSERTGCARPGG